LDGPNDDAIAIHSNDLNGLPGFDKFAFRHHVHSFMVEVSDSGRPQR
jgi:hypothetical protein